MPNRHQLTRAILACLLLQPLLAVRADEAAKPKPQLFARENLVAWCIVPFDAKKRGPEERAAMLQRLGIRKLAYDYRAEHVPTFDAEMQALKKHGIELTAWWFPTTLNDEARQILAVLQRHNVKTQLWVTGGGAPTQSPQEQQARVKAEADRIRPIAEAAAKIGCSVGLYNHGGWFGEPENQIEIIRQLQLANVGIVYNLHHGHAHLDRFPELLKKMQPHLYALNLNGMTKAGDQQGKKILPIGEGDLDLSLLRTIRDSGYRGPIGILNHTDHDAEARLRDNLDGLNWLVPQLDGKRVGAKPTYRTWKLEAEDEHARAAHDHAPAAHGVDNATPSPSAAPQYDAQYVASTLADAKRHGSAQRGVAVFAAAKFACLSCHKVGRHGGSVGPELAAIGTQRTAEQIVESVFWPKREVKPEYAALSVLMTDGSVLRGYKVQSDERTLVLRDPALGTTTEIARADIEAEQDSGTLMPDGLTEAMSREQQLDLIRLLIELGRGESLSAEVVDVVLGHAHAHAHAPAPFPYDRTPLEPQHWPNWQHHVNRDRLYDYYAKQAEYFRTQPQIPPLLPEFPGLDGGQLGHWGNQNEQVWADNRWNDTQLGSLQCGVFHGAGLTVPRGVCVRLGERGELSACFNPDTLTYDAVWSGGFVKFSSVRHGFVHGLLMDGTPLPRPGLTRPDATRLDKRFIYHGFYRHEKRIVFAYRIGDTEYLDAPWVEDGRFTRVVAPADQHPLKQLTAGGPPQWPQQLETPIVLGAGRPYAVDTITLPRENPWKALLFCGDHDFLPDGSALVCTMQGDVWHVSGLTSPQSDPSDNPATARWRRFASGLHHALGLVVAGDGVYVQGRDQITRLRDLNGDGEADFYECFSNAFKTSAAGHDFICGLQRDAAGNFYTASGNQGLVRISADGQRADVIATGFRNPDGLGLLPDGTLTVPCSEGDWTPASMICVVRASSQQPPFFGYRGPRDGLAPELPLVYLPRGLDNSSGGQTYVASDRWGPLQGQLLHFSSGAGTHFLVLRDEVDGQLQGAVVPLPGEFLSGSHRGRFNPRDGQLYVSGMAGWGSYTPADGCFQRVRYTGVPVQLPIGFHVHQNGVTVTFSKPLDAKLAGQPHSHFAQCWNYRYSAAYGSPELSTRHPGMRGHDSLTIASAHVLADGRTLFLELPELQPVNQLHLRLHVDAGAAHDLFVTVHKLDAAFSEFPGYQPIAKTIAPHPIQSDLALATKLVPNPHRQPIPNARPITLETGKNLTFAKRSFKVRAGEAIQFTLANPDVVPHNWALVKPGALQRVGELANRLVADPEAAARHYIPQSNDVLLYTDVVAPQDQFTIHFRAPAQPGRYPYLCTFPGHWMVMNGEMIVE
jgi:putative heme-binding domain-containing protein